MTANIKPYGNRTTNSQVADQAKRPQIDSPSQNAGGSPGYAPPPVTALGAPTERPGEPLTQGLPFGSGDGPRPSILDEDPTEFVRALIHVNGPNPDLLELLESMGGE